MGAKKLQTIEDLLKSGDERIELINGEIIKRPMARADHSLVQNRTGGELSVLGKKGGGEGWWIMSEISVRYNDHQCPTHDLAGWR